MVKSLSENNNVNELLINKFDGKYVYYSQPINHKIK